VPEFFPFQAQAPARACLIDVYDTILVSQFHARQADIIAPLGLALGDWLAEFEKLREDRDRGKVTIADSYGRTLRALGVAPDPDLVADICRRDAEYSRAHVRLCDDTIPFLRWLKSNGVVTALVSNCGDTTRAQLDRLGVSPLVDAVVLSCEVGSIKPYPEIYHAALDELGVAAVDAVFIDDQPVFCAGAEAVGVRAVQIDRGETAGGSGTRAAQGGFPVVHSLFDASSLFDVRLWGAGGGRLPFGILSGQV
jgi:HAD superfamily hydrolase (TIGR01509 family)